MRIAGTFQGAPDLRVFGSYWSNRDSVIIATSESQWCGHGIYVASRYKTLVSHDLQLPRRPQRLSGHCLVVLELIFSNFDIIFDYYQIVTDHITFDSCNSLYFLINFGHKGLELKLNIFEYVY